MDSKKTPPPAAAAAASPEDDDDEAFARKWNALEQLTQVFGFDMEAAKQAVEVVGPNVEAACSFILDSGLGEDKGGPVTPINNCPHLEQHAKVSPSDLNGKLSFAPMSKTTCSHLESGSTNKVGLRKVDVDDTTGGCPSTENWLCLDCGAVRCSRYVNGHGLVHWEVTKSEDPDSVGHSVALSLSDLSVWCYACSAYVTHPSLQPTLQHVHHLKFMDQEEKIQAASE